MENPYQSPEHASTASPESSRGQHLPTESSLGRQVLAVVGSFVVDIVGSTIIGTVGMAVCLFYMSAIGEADIVRNIEELESLGPVMIILHMMGLGMSVFSGYLCARIAIKNEWLCGVVLCFLNLLLGVVYAICADELVANMLLAFGAAGCVLAGVFLGTQHNAKKKEQAV